MTFQFYQETQMEDRLSSSLWPQYFQEEIRENL